MRTASSASKTTKHRGAKLPSLWNGYFQEAVENPHNAISSMHKLQLMLSTRSNCIAQKNGAHLQNLTTLDNDFVAFMTQEVDETLYRRPNFK